MTAKEQNTMSKAELEEYVAKLQAENETLKASKSAGRQPTVKPASVTDEAGNVHYAGHLAIYGLRRFPITLYATELRWILDSAEMLETFLDENKDNLQWNKDDKAWQEKKDTYKAIRERMKNA